MSPQMEAVIVTIIGVSLIVLGFAIGVSLPHVIW